MTEFEAFLEAGRLYTQELLYRTSLGVGGSIGCGKCEGKGRLPLHNDDRPDDEIIICTRCGGHGRIYGKRPG